MDIKLLPANSSCLVDANILLYHIAGTSADSKGFLQRVANEEVQAYLTNDHHRRGSASPNAAELL